MDRSVLYAVISFSAAAVAYAALGFLATYGPRDEMVRTLQGIAGGASILAPLYFLRVVVARLNRELVDSYGRPNDSDQGQPA